MFRDVGGDESDAVRVDKADGTQITVGRLYARLTPALQREESPSDSRPRPPTPNLQREVGPSHPVTGPRTKQPGGPPVEGTPSVL